MNAKLKRAPPSSLRWWLAGLIAIYFLYFAAGALRARFAIDDPMNLSVYWHRGLLHSIGDVFAFWNESYRPMAALFYLPIYNFFGLNPLPYRIAVLTILALNVYLSYRIAMRLTRSLPAATLTALLVSAQANMTPVFYNTSQIYDVLAFLFTALMLDIYMSARERDGPTLLESIAIILLFLAAMNSKEIAVVGAIWLTAYELLQNRPWKLTVPAILIALAIAFTLTRALGPHSLSTQPGYRLEITAHRFFENVNAYANDLFYTSWFDKNFKLIAAWTLGTLLCAAARKRELWWTWILLSTATLPVAFTASARGGPGLYLPLLAAALWLATLVTIFFRQYPIREWSAAALIAVLIIPTTLHDWNDRAQYLIREQQEPWSVISQLRDLNPRPAPHSTVLFVKNPFPDWDLWFMATLAWHDPTLDPKLADKMNPPPNPATFDWVLTFEDGRLKVLRSRK